MKIQRSTHVATMARILESLPGTGSDVMRRTGLTYSHILKIVKEYEDKNILTVTKTGRCLNIELTHRGTRLKMLILEVERILNPPRID